MANSYVEYTAAGGTAGPYNVPFLYLKKAHVVVTKDGVVVSDYTWTSASQITFNANVTAGVKIKFARNTPETPLFNSADGNVLTDTQLKVLGRQAIYLAEETNDASNDTLALAEAAIAVAEDAAAEVAADTGAAAASAVAAAASAVAAATAETNAETAETNAEAAQAAAEAAQLAAENAAGSMNPASNIAYTGNNTHSGSETFTGDVSVLDSKLVIKDNADATKVLKFETSGITTGTTRTLTVPDANITIAGRDNAETLTNKTLTAPAITSPLISTGLEWPDGIIQYRSGWERYAADSIPSSAASVDITAIPSSVKIIKVFFTLVPATHTAAPLLRLSQAGSFVTSSSYQGVHHEVNNSGGNVASNFGPTTSISLAPNGVNSVAGNANLFGIDGEIDIFNPEASRYPRVHATTWQFDSINGYRQVMTIMGTLAVNAAVDGFTLFFGSGNIASGRVTTLVLRG